MEIAPTAFFAFTRQAKCGEIKFLLDNNYVFRGGEIASLISPFQVLSSFQVIFKKLKFKERDIQSYICVQFGRGKYSVSKLVLQHSRRLPDKTEKFGALNSSWRYLFYDITVLKSTRV